MGSYFAALSSWRRMVVQWVAEAVDDTRPPPPLRGTSPTLWGRGNMEVRSPALWGRRNLKVRSPACGGAPGEAG